MHPTLDVGGATCFGNLGGLVYQEEGLDIEVPVEPMRLPVLGRALTSEHIRALYFPTKAGQTHCQIRLKLLFHHGYLFRDEQPTKLAEGRRPLVYFLDQRGQPCFKSGASGKRR